MNLSSNLKYEEPTTFILDPSKTILGKHTLGKTQLQCSRSDLPVILIWRKHQKTWARKPSIIFWSYIAIIRPMTIWIGHTVAKNLRKTRANPFAAIWLRKTYWCNWNLSKHGNKDLYLIPDWLFLSWQRSMWDIISLEWNIVFKSGDLAAHPKFYKN